MPSLFSRVLDEKQQRLYADRISRGDANSPLHPTGCSVLVAGARFQILPIPSDKEEAQYVPVGQHQGC